MNNVDMGTVIANTLFSFTFSGILTLLVLVGVCVLWCTVPFAVFGVKKRLDGIEVAQRSQTEMLIGELKRINENLRQRVSAGAAAAEPPGYPAPQPEAQPTRPQTVRPAAAQVRQGARPATIIDPDVQAAMDEAERELTGRTHRVIPPRPPAPVPARPTAPGLRPPPPAAPVSAAATMFGPRPRQ